MTLIQLPLHVLCRVLTGLASDPVSILAFGFTCRRAYDVASDEQLVWKPLCIALGWGDATPEAWGAISFKHLVLALVHPCTPLLGDWTSPDVFPTGRLLRVEARPPQVLGVSLYYRTLNGPPNCHAVFHIRLPEQQQGAPPVKAVVSCLKRSQQHAGSSSADDSHPASLVLRSDRRSFHLRCAVSCNAGLCEAICRHSYAQAYDPAVGPVLALPSSTRNGSSASASSSGPTTPEAAAAGAEGPPAAPAAASSHSWTSSCSDQGEEWPEINVRPWDAGLVQMGSILALSSTLSHRQCVPVYSRLHWQQHVGEGAQGAGVAGVGGPPPVGAAADGCGLDFTTMAAPVPMAAGLPVVNGHTTAAASASASHAAELLLPPDVLLLQGMWRGTYGCHGVELISVSLLQLGHDIDEPPPAKPQPPALQEEQPSLSPGTAAGAQGAPWSVVSAPLVRAGGPWQPGEAPQGGHAGGPMQGSWPGAPWGMEPPAWGGSSSSGCHAAAGAPLQAQPAAAAAAAACAWPAALQPQQHTWSPGASVSPLSSPNLPWVLAPPGRQLSAQQQQQLGSLAGSGSSVLHEEDMDSEEQELLQMALPSNDYDSEPDSLSDIEDAESGGVVLYEPTLSSESDSEDGYLLDQAGSGVSLGGPGGASAAAAGGVVSPTAPAAAGGAAGGAGGVGASATGSGVTGSGAPGAASSGGTAPAEATMTGWGSSMTRSFSGVLLADAFGASARPGPLLWHPTAAAAAAAARAPQGHPHALPAHARSRLAVMTSGPPFTPGVVLLAPSTEASSGNSSSSEAPGASGMSDSSPLGQPSSQVERGVLPYSSMYGTATASSDAALHALRTRSEVPPVRATAADVLLRQLRGSSYAAGVAALPHQQAAGSVGSSNVSGACKAAAAAGFTRLSAPAAGWSPAAAAGAGAWGAAAAGAGPSNLQQPAVVHNLAAPTGAGAADQLMQLFQRQQQQQALLAEAAMEPGLASAQLAALQLSPGSGSQHAAGAAPAGGAAGDLTAAHLAATSLPSLSAPVAPAAPLQLHQQQQQQEADLGQTFWYAVGRKVTGDLNVPAGKVSFVVDISSRSTEHAGEVLALKLGYDTDVALHKAGTRRLVERVRYQGRAQLAFHGFERPSVIGAELLLFDDDCFGLMWHGPVQSLSLYVRVRQP